MANFEAPVEKRLAASNIAEDKCEEYLNSCHLYTSAAADD